MPRTTEDLEMDGHISRGVTFGNPFMVSDGIGSSGKRLLAHIAGLIEGVEKLTHNPWFETVATLHWLGELSTPSAIGLLRTEADRHTYHLLLGRDVNLRRGETTSIFSNPQSLRYVRRILLQQEGEAAAERIRREAPIVNEGTHDGLRSGPLFEEAFGDRLLLLHVVRHPAGLALDWLLRGFDASRFGVDPRETQLLVDRSGSKEPVFLLGEEPGAFDRMNSKEQVLAMLAFCYEQNLAGLEQMSDLARVRLYSFDSMLAEPGTILSDIEELTGRRRVVSPRRIFRRERVPRTPPSPALLEGQLAPHESAVSRDYYERCLDAHDRLLRYATPLGSAG
jgi:hypothetical protein